MGAGSPDERLERRSVWNNGTDGCQAGAASVSVEPPLGLPMGGFLRRHRSAAWSAADLEVTAAVVERSEQRAVLCTIDTLGIHAPASDRLRVRRPGRRSVHPVMLNFSHTDVRPRRAPVWPESPAAIEGPAVQP